MEFLLPITRLYIESLYCSQRIDYHTLVIFRFGSYKRILCGVFVDPSVNLNIKNHKPKSKCFLLLTSKFIIKHQCVRKESVSPSITESM